MAITLTMSAVIAVACAGSGDPADGPTVQDSGAAGGSMTIEEVLAEHTARWMEIDGVEGTGLGLCDTVPCIKIFVSRPSESFAGVLPDTAAGYPVRLEPTGTFEKR
ncbi:MAG: hypothetical protein OEM96_04905 [Gemmatimonadota bacterium]|nr:hypothetical protein [Gemmatimonadota bacterium]